MDSALLVSTSEKSLCFFTEMLRAVGCEEFTAASSCARARELYQTRDFDYTIINAPLPDESGESLAIALAKKGCTQVVLVVKDEYLEEVAGHVEDWGVIAVSKPIVKKMFLNALKLAKAARKTVRRLQTENSELLRRMEELRLISRAKCILISYHSMSEAEAHKYIEKQAMDLRKSRRAVSEGIIKTYEI